MDSSGLKEIIVQAKLLLPGTFEKVFQGKCYYQDINAYCILYEVLLALYWESLEEYYSEAQEDLSRLNQLGSAIELFRTSLANGANARTPLQKANDTLIPLAPMNAFETLRNASPTFSFWRQFLEILQIVMQFNIILNETLSRSLI